MYISVIHMKYVCTCEGINHVVLESLERLESRMILEYYNPDETLSLVFNVLLQYPQSTCVLPVEIANDYDMMNKTLNIIFLFNFAFSKQLKLRLYLLTQ